MLCSMVHDDSCHLNTNDMKMSINATQTKAEMKTWDVLICIHSRLAGRIIVNTVE